MLLLAKTIRTIILLFLLSILKQQWNYMRICLLTRKYQELNSKKNVKLFWKKLQKMKILVINVLILFVVALFPSIAHNVPSDIFLSQ